MNTENNIILKQKLNKAVKLINESSFTTVFTGAGISVASGISAFRGKDGIWNRHNPKLLELDYFSKHPIECWEFIRQLFYQNYGTIKPNPAHYALAELERKGFLRKLITQNIDNLHRKAGNTEVLEFHGTIDTLVCIKCGNKESADFINKSFPPVCEDCDTVLKPDFIFFGEAIPEPAATKSVQAAAQSEVMIIVGTTGEVMPAAMIPRIASDNNAFIIEINIEPSNYTSILTDVFIPGKAEDILPALVNLL